MHATITSKAGCIDVERDRLPRKGRVETCHECLGGPLSHSYSVQNSFHSDVWPSHVSSCLQWPHRDKYLNAPWHPRQRFRSRDEKKIIYRLIMIELEKFKALTFVQNENRKLSLLMWLIAVGASSDLRRVLEKQAAHFNVWTIKGNLTCPLYKWFSAI